MRHLLAAFLLLGVLRADTLAELRTKFEAMQGPENLRADIAVQVSKKSDDDAQAKVSSARVVVSETNKGLSLTWDNAVLAKLKDERAEKLKNPEAASPLRSALGEFDLNRAYEYFHAAEGLLKKLDQAELISESTQSKEGKTLRQLNFKVTPKLSAKDKKYIKSLEATATLLLDEQGVPVEASTRIQVKGRAFLVISFESEEKEAFSFAKLGDRLVITRHVRESKGSGAGEKNESRSEISCKVERL